MFIIIFLLFVCLLVAGFIGTVVGKGVDSKLSSKQNFLIGIIGFVSVGGIVALICWGYLNSLPNSEIYVRGNAIMKSLMIFSFVSAIIGAVLAPYFINRCCKK